ncbi:chloramphenicol-sensitive protein RarD [Rhodoligotrophos appendicifer]|uniref:EamA family transporter RarD n=1 Tax=Rhodoligotrophos appendicifer TaxID=987056 RepID=UPI001184D0E0|nr:EamA family transporter RarD [Rhodoligotrophos appendicifer]
MASIQLEITAHERALAESRKGFFCGLAAYVIWGFVTVYYKLAPHIPPLEIVAHRAAWAVPFAVVVLMVLGGGATVGSILRTWRIMRVLMFTATIIAINWSLFIWAVANDRILESSLAYYINPLISVALGFALLGERLTRAQGLAIGIAAVAVVFQTTAEGVFPWLALALASSFATYGYLRKQVPVGAVEGFLVEAMVMTPVAVGAIVWFEVTGQGHLFTAPLDALYLIVGAVVTGAPLMLFAAAARRLRLSTLGLMQYIGPSIGFLFGVFWFHEPLTTVRLITFILIWVALALFSWSALRRDRPAVDIPPS